MNDVAKGYIYYLGLGSFLGILAEHANIGKYVIIPSLVVVITGKLIWKL